MRSAALWASTSTSLRHPQSLSFHSCEAFNHARDGGTKGNSGSSVQLRVFRGSCFFPSTDAQLFFRTRQNEVIPNQANVTVKHEARISRPGPDLSPAWYFTYSLNPAVPNTAARTRKKNPVTSSQSWCRTRAKDPTAACTPVKTAAPIRVAPARRAATFAAMPIFLILESFGTGRF